MKHDSNVVHAFLGKVLYHLKCSWSLLQKCISFSNVAISQYKNYKNFANLCQHTSDFILAAELNFFTTLHRKSPGDSIEGTVKCLVASANLWSLSEPSDTPQKNFLWCKNNIKGVRFLSVSHSVVENHV